MPGSRSLDDQLVGQQLGSVVFQFGLREAREVGWLPEYTVHHHGVRLTTVERRDYERVSRKVTDAADHLTSGGFQTSQAWPLAAGRGGWPLGTGVHRLAGRTEGLPVPAIGARGSLPGWWRRRCAREYRRGCCSSMSGWQRLEGSSTSCDAACPNADRDRALRVLLRHGARPGRFRTGDFDVLVSVKSLVEGIDVPDADVGVSVASSSSVRQRIRTLGRVLRRRSMVASSRPKCT